MQWVKSTFASLIRARAQSSQRPESTELEPRDDLGYRAPMFTTAEPLDGRTEGPRWSWMAAGLGALTAATLLLEIVITRIFSVVLLYHFAFMAVSLALFGIGLAGIGTAPGFSLSIGGRSSTSNTRFCIALSIASGCAKLHVICIRRSGFTCV